MSAALPSWVDGALVAAGAPALPSDDQGFTLGLAVFETILQEDGRRYFEDEHLERLHDGARVLGIAWPPPHDPRAALADYGATLGAGAFAVRLSLSRGSPGGAPRMVIGARPNDASATRGVTVAIADEVKPLDPRLEGTKSTNRLRNVLAREAALARGAWEALVRTTDGDVAEGTVSNLFVARGDDLLTPSLERGALPGIVRGELLAACAADGVRVREGRVELADLEACDEVFLSNSLVRIAPVDAVLGLREDLPGAAGPWARRAAAWIAGREALDAARHRAGSAG